MSRPSRRCKIILCRFRMLVLCFLTVMAYMWYRLLSHSDIDLYNSALYNDPSDFLQAQNEARNNLDENTLAPFPVLPNNADKKQTTPAPLLETNIIPGASEFRARFKMALEPHTSHDILLSIVDYGFIDMTLNFIKTSVEKLELQSVFVPVCLDQRSDQVLDQYGYNCVLLDLAQKGSLLASDFGSEEYYRKTNIKTWVVLQALSLGRTILLSDVDIILFKNPFSYFKCSECDIHIQMDRELYNSGFVYARPTSGSLAVYDNAWRFYLQYHTGHDQAYVNMAITMLTKNDSVKVESLSWRQFPCGVYYFEQDYRQFYNQPTCQDCVMAHNNYMGSTAAKIYRFKENLLWEVDQDGYYSSKETKYLTYENPYDFGKDTADVERSALLNAMVLANLTNRILILPSFRCCNCRIRSCDHPVNRCSLLSVLKLKTFDQFFKGKYREHSFLSHKYVPDAIKNSQSPLIKISTSADLSNSTDISHYVIKNISYHEHKSYSIKEDAISSEAILSILDHFSDYSVIRLYSLYGPFNFSKDVRPNGDSLQSIFKAGIECALYEQWEQSLEKKFFG